MATTITDAPPVAAGLPFALRISVTGYDAVPFPSGVALVGHVRETPGADATIAELSTDDGTITRVDDDTVDITMTAAQTGAITTAFVWLDFVRTDSDPDEYTYVRVRIPVITPTTRDYE